MKTLYLGIKDYLGDMIEKRGPEEMLPTEAQLCEIFEVSRVPVRRAMEDLVKEGLIYRKKGKGTFIRKVSPLKHRLNFTVVLPPRATKETPFYLNICTGILTKAAELGAGTYFFSFTGSIKEMLDETKVSPEDGIIWIAPNKNVYKVLEELRERGYQVMILNRVMNNSHFNYVSTDHKKGARNMTLYLLDKGHKKIGFIGLGEGSLALKQRYEGFLQAFQLRGINFPQDGLVKRQEGDPHFSGFKKDLTGMFARYSPTAFFLCGGHLLDAVLKWMKENNLRVTKDLEIATFDEVPPAHEKKECIHEVIQPLEKLGILAAEEMGKIIMGKKSLVRIILPPDIKIKKGIVRR